MPHLTQDKATRLMLRTCDPPRIRIADNLLDLDEAKPAADAMFAILQTDYQWSFPSADKHLATWHDDRDKSRCTRSANEDEKLYQQSGSVVPSSPAMRFTTYSNATTKGLHST
ncbi:hypothetical protein FOFC_16013 [Fusarium oxysporum]|nr:hypothetical protein FOFC_16013 [Fusarium oxysporum]